MSVNQVVLVGRLGRDPEIKTTQSGTEVCKLSVATSRKYKGEEQTQWHRVTVFGKAAEACGRFLSKGRQVAVTGRIEYSESERDGVKRYFTDIIAQDVQFIGGKGDSAGPSYPEPAGAVSSRFGSAPPPYDPGDAGSDDIPF